MLTEKAQEILKILRTTKMKNEAVFGKNRLGSDLVTAYTQELNSRYNKSQQCAAVRGCVQPKGVQV